MHYSHRKSMPDESYIHNQEGERSRSRLLRTTTGERGSSLDTEGVWLRLGESSVSWATSFFFSPSPVLGGEDTSNGGRFSSLEGLFYGEMHDNDPGGSFVFSTPARHFLETDLNFSKMNSLIRWLNSAWWFKSLHLSSPVYKSDSNSLPSAWVTWGSR